MSVEFEILRDDDSGGVVVKATRTESGGKTETIYHLSWGQAKQLASDLFKAVAKSVGN